MAIVDFIRFTRFPMFLVPVGAFIGGMAVNTRRLPEGGEWLAIVATVCLSAGMFAFNGYCDRKIDKRKKMFFANWHPRFTLFYSLVLYLLAVALPEFGSPFFLTMVGLTVGTILYSLVLVNIPGLKNVGAAVLFAAFILVGGIAVGGVNSHHWHLFAVICLAITAMEVVKDVEDVSCDRGSRETLPAIFTMTTIQFIVFCLIAAAAVVAFFLPHAEKSFYAWWLATVCLFLAGWDKLPSQLDTVRAASARRYIYAGLWFGLIMIGYTI